jgi:hypothetical protein
MLPRKFLRSPTIVPYFPLKCVVIFVAWHFSWRRSKERVAIQSAFGGGWPPRHQQCTGEGHSSVNQWVAFGKVPSGNLT